MTLHRRDFLKGALAAAALPAIPISALEARSHDLPRIKFLITRFEWDAHIGLAVDVRQGGDILRHAIMLTKERDIPVGIEILVDWVYSEAGKSFDVPSREDLRRVAVYELITKPNG